MTSEFSYICPKDECTGCMACINACAHASIVVKRDPLGFRYPVINNSTCTNCGLCYKVCPQLNRRQLEYPQKCYAAISKSQNDQETCSSGGIATVLSRAVLKNGGIVAGCSGVDIKNVHHEIIDSIENIDQLRGSKYVQSLISPTLFKDIRKYLLSGRTVLFIGTGCQVAGLKNFLIKDYPNLITVDLVCHGVPSQQMLDEDLYEYSSYNLTNIQFRKKIKHKSNPKIKGEKYIHYGISAIQSKNNSKTPKTFWIPWYKDAYLGSFMSCINFREGCYKCLYAQAKRQSDITICDYWGLGKDSKLYSKTGVSAVLINSIVGNDIFQQISSELDFELREVEEAVRGNGQLMNPSEKNRLREQFIDEYKKNGIRNAYRKTVYLSMIKKHLRSQSNPILYKTYRFLKKIFK